MSKAKTKTYLFHEISSYLPLLEGEEFDALVEDIREFGQIEPAVLFEGKIIDGRNRYRACKQLGIELQIREWNPSEFTGMTPLQFVISENIMRRHLNTAQKSEVGLLLLEEEEKLAQKRQSELMKERSKLAKRDEKGRIEELPEVKDFSQLSEGKSRDIVGTKVKVSGATLGQAKKIKEVAKNNPIIAEEWEKAKKGEQGVDAVYEKAKIIENIESLPKKQQDEIKKKISSEPISKVQKFVEEKKDEQLRLEDAKKSVELRKKQEEMEALYRKINDCKNKIEAFNKGIKNSEAKLTVLVDDVIEKHPEWKGKDSDYVLTNLSLLYDTLDTEIYNNQLRELRSEYNELINPLREKIRKLEEEYDAKKKEITKQKTEKEKQIKWIEEYQDLIYNEHEKIGSNKNNIEKAEQDLKELLKEYDAKYK